MKDNKKTIKTIGVIGIIHKDRVIGIKEKGIIEIGTKESSREKIEQTT